MTAICMIGMGYRIESGAESSRAEKWKVQCLSVGEKSDIWLGQFSFRMPKEGAVMRLPGVCTIFWVWDMESLSVRETYGLLRSWKRTEIGILFVCS